MKCNTMVYSLIGLFLTTTIVHAKEQIDFNRDIRPIISDTCVSCHGPDANTRKANLRFDLEDGFRAKTTSGSPIITPGKSEASELYRRITSTDADERMPPADSSIEPLNTLEIFLIKNWIDEGAHWQPHWAFVPPIRPEVPPINNSSWPLNEIDHFIAHRLTSTPLSPSNLAPKETLIRRVSLDLIGLPPTLKEVEAFLSDTSGNAYEKLVDRLLDSPHYGERMAFPWLDAARYADTHGYQSDSKRTMWLWRDWVINAFNSNMPFDQFTIEQLAGDLLPNATDQQKIATGFNRNHRINGEDGIIPEEYAVEYVADRVITTATTWMGLTLECARCHDHKYDPISQKEFYRMFAFFNNVPESGLGADLGNDNPVLEFPTEEQRTQQELLRKRILTLEGDAKKDVEKDLNTLNAAILSTMIMQEMDTPRDTFLLKRGDYTQPDTTEPLSSGVPESLGKLDSALPKNRLGFAQWLINPQQPLTARVRVNQLWQQLFGKGLVVTSEDFGTQGSPPTHPALLDWLAVEFQESGWDTKALLKKIVMSATYRQQSINTPKHRQHDPNNYFLARAPRLRLSAEIIRDQALSHAGLLNATVGGPSVKPYQPPKVWSALTFQRKSEFTTNYYEQDTGDKVYRRGLYTYWKRTIAPPRMQIFDAANREACSIRTQSTNTPLQAMVLLNDPTFVEAARNLAQNMILEGGPTAIERIHYGYRRVLAYSPDLERQHILLSGLNDYQAHYYSHPEDAKALIHIGDSTPSLTIPDTELAAYTLLASVILNLDETITRE